MADDNSPEMQGLISTKNAKEQSLMCIRRTYNQENKENEGNGRNNTNLATNNSFQVGVNLNSSVNLMELKHSIKGADAQVKLADNEITLFKKDLYFEVKRAFNNYDKAKREIPTTQLRAKQAFGGIKTSFSIFTADIKTFGGKLKTTAPQVPPSTINAAVICNNCPMLPPSIA